MKVHALTFASSNMSCRRLQNECINSMLFNTITALTEKDLPIEFQQTLIDRINKYGMRGYGYWSWKPYIILNKLNEIDDGDILIYMDAGDTFNFSTKEAVDKFNEYIEQIKNAENGLLGNRHFGNSVNYTTKKLSDKVGEFVGHRFTKDELSVGQICSTEIFIRKCDNSVKIINEFNEFMQNNFDFVTDAHNNDSDNYERFIDNRHDQSVWALLCTNYGIKEINNGKFWWSNFSVEEAKRYPILETRKRYN